MLKKILIFSLLILISNCASPGSAFLGPVITGAKTGSVYQASLSYSSGKIANVIKDTTLKEFTKKKINILKDTIKQTQPPVLVAVLQLRLK